MVSTNFNSQVNGREFTIIIKVLSANIQIGKLVYHLLEWPRGVTLERPGRRGRGSLDEVLGPSLARNSSHLIHFPSQHQAHNGIMTKEALLFLDSPPISPPDSPAISALGLTVNPVNNQLSFHVVDNGIETKYSHPTIPIFPAIPGRPRRKILVKFNPLVLEKTRIEEKSMRWYDQRRLPPRG